MEVTSTAIISFEQACSLRGYDHQTILPDVSKFPTQHQKAILAFAMLIIIAEAMNEGHQFDWNDWDEEKWYPWFDMEVTDDNPSGFRFYVAYFVYSFTYSSGGSRLCFRTQAAAKHAGKTFLPLYRDIMVIEK